MAQRDRRGWTPITKLCVLQRGLQVPNTDPCDAVQGQLHAVHTRQRGALAEYDKQSGGGVGGEIPADPATMRRRRTLRSTCRMKLLPV